MNSEQTGNTVVDIVMRQPKSLWVVLATETSSVCLTCGTETRTAAIEGVSYEAHVCTSCRTVTRLDEVGRDAFDHESLERGRLRTPAAVVHVCDKCEAVVGICPQCRKEREKTQSTRRWLP